MTAQPRPVPQRDLPEGVVCALTADGRPPGPEDLAVVDQFKRYLAARRAAGLTNRDPDTDDTRWENFDA